MDPGIAPASWSCGGWPEVPGRSSFAGPARKRSHPARVGSRAGQNANSKNDGLVYSNRVSTTAIYARSFARGLDRYAHLQPAHGRIYDEARTTFFEFNSGRRNQSRARKSAERVAGGDARTAGHDRRKDLSAVRSVSGFSDAKPARAGRDLSVTGGATRSLHVEVEYWLSAKVGGATDSRSDGDVGTRSAREPSNRPTADHRRTRRGNRNLHRGS